MQVLLVDDNPLMQQVISRFLSSHGYSVLVAEDGHEAMKFARQEKIGLFLIDMRLPDVDGPVLLQRLRLTPGLENCPAIAVSGLGEADRPQTVKAGFEMFLVKPIDLDVLLASVEHHLGTGRSCALSG